MSNLHTPERLDGESFKQYQERRKQSKRASKQIRKGTLVWDAMEKGTYRKYGGNNR